MRSTWHSCRPAFDRWHEWALRQRDFITGGGPGITEQEYDIVAKRFAEIGLVTGGKSN